MMTEREMKAFLKKEGWQIGGFHPKREGVMLSAGSIVDPLQGRIYGCGLLRMCYRIASRRRAVPERKALRRAGFWYDRAINRWRLGVSQVRFYTKKEALQTLQEKP